MKKWTAMLLAVLMLGGCASPSADQATSDGSEKKEEVVNIYTWADYLPPDVIADFEKETNIKVNFTSFTQNEDMLEKLRAVKGGEYDLIIASDYAIDIAVKEGLAGELKKDLIPNYDNIDPEFQGQYFDPENKYTVPYIAGTPLIVYDPAIVTVPIDGYESLWDPSLKDSVAAMDDMRNLIGITLRTMGKTLNETDPAALEEAKTKLLELKPNIRTLDYNNGQAAIMSGEASVGYLFTSQVNEAIKARPDLEVVYPKEGLGYGIDAWFMPANAPHSENAAKFLNFVMEGERAAYIIEQVGYTNTNQAAKPFLSEEYLNNPVLNIPASALENAQMIENIGNDATALYDQVWTEFKK